MLWRVKLDCLLLYCRLCERGECGLIVSVVIVAVIMSVKCVAVFVSVESVAVIVSASVTVVVT